MEPCRRRRSSLLPGVSLPALCLLGAACQLAPDAPVRHTPPARRDSRLMWEARRADALGLTPTASFSTYPVSKGDMLRALGEGVPAEGSGEEPPGQGPGQNGEEPVRDHPGDSAWFGEVIERNRAGIDDQWETEHQSTHLEPIDDARLRYIAVDETVHFYNEQGREFNKGSNLYLSNRASARLLNRLVITADPELSVVENRDISEEDTSAILRFQELSLSARLGPAEITVGRTPLWWGPGRHGSLLLSNNARPFDLIKLSTAGPVLLPWYFSYLGLLRGEFFVTRLESARGVPRPYLAGVRVSSRVNRWIEFGASRTAQFGGRGRSVTGQTIWEVITASTENDEDDPGNQLASIDLRLILPWSVQPVELYGEIGGEDEAGGFFSREAYLGGFYLPRVGPWHFLEFTFEYANTTVRGNPLTWYTNINFPDGYTFHEEIIGHHVGTDGEDFFAEVRVHPPVIPSFMEGRDLAVFLSYNYEEHFRLDDVEERVHQVRAGVEAEVWRKLRAMAFFQIDRWNNFRQNRGQDETGHAVGLGARWEF